MHRLFGLYERFVARRGRVSFWQEQSGVVAVIFALSLLPVMIILGGAIDFSRVAEVRSSMQKAADSAALAAMNTWLNNSVAPTNAAPGYFHEMNARGLDVSTSLSSDGAGSVTVTATTSVPASFLRLVGMNSIPINVSSVAAASLSGGRKVEVAIVLDTTWSMSVNNKMTFAANAARSLIDSLLRKQDGILDSEWLQTHPEAKARIASGEDSYSVISSYANSANNGYDVYVNQYNFNVKIGVVPFSNYVSVDPLLYQNAAWLTETQDKVTAHHDRYCPPSYMKQDQVCASPAHCTNTVAKTCYNDGVPSSCDYCASGAWVPASDCSNSGAPYEVRPTCIDAHDDISTWSGCLGSKDATSDEAAVADASNKVPTLYQMSCSAPMLRLTGVFDTGKFDYRPYNKVLTNAKATMGGETYIPAGLIWGWRLLSPEAPFKDGAAYGDADKVIVLMTDGENTRSANYPTHSASNPAEADAKLLKICSAIKAKGIRIYTVAFNVTSDEIISLLSQCATDKPYFYNPQTNAELTMAFGNIASKMTAVHLVQ